MNIQTEYAYLLFRKAMHNPAGTRAAEYVQEGTELLNANIAYRGKKDPHSYHVLGTNMLEWIERGLPNFSDRKAELEVLMEVIKQGSVNHPTNEHLRILLEKLQHVYLSLAIVK